MKTKGMKTAWTGLWLVAASLVFMSGMCSDDSSSDPKDPVPVIDPVVEPETPSTDNALSPEDQKEKLEQVALDFIKKVPASDFEELTEFVSDFNDLYADYDWSNVEDWAEDVWNGLHKSLGTKTTVKTDEWYSDWSNQWYRYYDVYSNYTALVMASNFTGHFYTRRNGWEREEASDLSFTFNDAKGQQCVLKLTTGGQVKKVHVGKIDEWEDYEWDEYNSYDYYDRTDLTVGIPESIEVTLTQAGKNVVKTNVKFDLSSISGESFDISKSGLTCSTVTELNNGYKFNVSQVAYKGNQQTAVAFSVEKNSEKLITTSVSSKVSGVPSATTVDADLDNEDFDNANAKDAVVFLDILGKLQIQGTLSDVRKFAEYLDKAYDNDERESTFKSYINQANELADVNLFYDGSSVKQATVLLEAFQERDWYGSWWDVEPVLKFYDGSSYSTFEAFFNETSFKSVIKSFERLVDDYNDLIDEYEHDVEYSTH